MTASIDTARAHAAQRTAHVQGTRAPAIAAEPTHVVASDTRPVGDAFGSSRPLDAVRGFAARAAQRLDVMHGAIRASLAALQGEGALGRVSAVATLGLAALGFQAQAAAPSAETSPAAGGTVATAASSAVGVAADNLSGPVVGLRAGMAISYAPALEETLRDPRVLYTLISRLEERRGISMESRLPNTRDPVADLLMDARAAVTQGKVDEAQAHIAEARQLMQTAPTREQVEATRELIMQTRAFEFDGLSAKKNWLASGRLLGRGDVVRASAAATEGLDYAITSRLRDAMRWSSGDGHRSGASATTQMHANGLDAALAGNDVVAAEAIADILKREVERDAEQAAERAEANRRLNNVVMGGGLLGGVALTLLLGRRRKAGEAKDAKDAGDAGTPAARRTTRSTESDGGGGVVLDPVIIDTPGPGALSGTGQVLMDAPGGMHLDTSGRLHIAPTTIHLAPTDNDPFKLG